MVKSLSLRKLARLVRIALTGPQTLAFLPAAALAAFWLGGENLLILCALATPLAYALTGGFGAGGRFSDPGPEDPRTVAATMLDGARRNGQTTACLQLELSGLSDIARSLGDDIARDARNTVQDRMSAQLRDGDRLFRTGDARFVVLLAPGYRLNLDALLQIATRLRSAAEEPLALEGTTRFLQLAVGLCSSLTLGRTASVEDWFDAASQALSEALLNGPSTTRAWSRKLKTARHGRRVLRDDLRTALDTGQIQAYFQPQISLRTGRITGMEALARWDHPNRGIIPPAEFLRALEDSGKIDRLGFAMLVQSLTALQRWDMAGLDIPAVSVNFSASELRNPALPDKVKWELDRFGLTGGRLGIEVLESVVAGQSEGMIRRNLSQLAAIGCCVDLDDFGTGHASITSLQRFPIRRVKIDRSFVTGADTDEGKRRLLAAIIGMASRLRLETVAEGVESPAETALLRTLNCTHAQGFLFARPMPMNEVEAWASTRNSEIALSERQAVSRRLQ